MLKILSTKNVNKEASLKKFIEMMGAAYSKHADQIHKQAMTASKK
jgi:hypothetical protein